MVCHASSLQQVDLSAIDQMAVAPLTPQLYQADLLAFEYYMAAAVTPLLYQVRAAVAPGIVVAA